MNLDTDLVSNIRINLSAIERRTSTLTKRRSVKKECLRVYANHWRVVSALPYVPLFLDSSQKEKSRKKAAPIS